MTDAYGPPYWVDGDFESVNGFPRYPAREMRRRHSWLDDRMATHDLQAIVVGGSTGPLETSVQFFTNWPPQVQSYSVFAAGEAPSLLVRLWNHLPDAHRIAAIERVTYGGDTPRDQALSLAGMLRHMGARRVGLIGIVPHGDLAVIRTEFPALELIDLNDDYRSFRLAKSDDEMVFVEIASRMNDAAVAALACELRPGIREYEVAKIVEDVYLAHRAWNLIHFSLTTPMRAPQICVPHQYHPDRTIAAGDVFVTEISTTFWGYAGQILRTFTIGEPPTPRYADLHAVALDASSG
ncbi:MAG: M24 family metallopeptidase, partial [Acidimicrobiia bacterium]|nr:M24 family metallopeptidase [Acidimicrobiia bacterium]